MYKLPVKIRTKSRLFNFSPSETQYVAENLQLNF